MAEVGIMVNNENGDGDHIAELAMVTLFRIYEECPEYFESEKEE